MPVNHKVVPHIHVSSHLLLNRKLNLIDRAAVLIKLEESVTELCENLLFREESGKLARVLKVI